MWSKQKIRAKKEKQKTATSRSKVLSFNKWMPWYPYPIQRQGVELLESLELSKARKFVEQWSSELLFLVIGAFHHEILEKIFGCGRAPGYLQQPIRMDTGRLLIQIHNGCICCEIKNCEKKQIVNVVSRNKTLIARILFQNIVFNTFKPAWPADEP